MRFGTTEEISMIAGTKIFWAYACSLLLIVLLIQIPGSLEIGHVLTDLPGNLMTTLHYLAMLSIDSIMYGAIELLQDTGEVLIGSLRLVTALTHATVTLDGEAIINIAIHVATIGIRG